MRRLDFFDLWRLCLCQNLSKPMLAKKCVERDQPLLQMLCTLNCLNLRLLKSRGSLLEIFCKNSYHFDLYFSWWKIKLNEDVIPFLKNVNVKELFPTSPRNMLGNDKIKFTQFSWYNPETSTKKYNTGKLGILKILHVFKGVLRKHS